MKKTVTLLLTALTFVASYAMDSQKLDLVTQYRDIAHRFYQNPEAVQDETKRNALGNLPKPVQTHILDLAKKQVQTPYIMRFFQQEVEIGAREETISLFKKYIQPKHYPFLYIIQLPIHLDKRS